MGKLMNMKKHVFHSAKWRPWEGPSDLAAIYSQAQRSQKYSRNSIKGESADSKTQQATAMRSPALPPTSLRPWLVPSLRLAMPYL